ncbi:MAG: PspC domain-containing protein [Bacteroidales bacterium]|nr:PspC domain-containing protein [Bacteroidales bacterium]
MKPIQQVSIGGYAFKLENDAAEAMRSYLGTLESHYMPREGGAEIMEGIEERIAELLLDRKNRVITIADIQNVTDIIGKPETIEADDPSDSPETAAPVKKRLFRDLENKRVGGVCSGLAAYFNFDVAIIRAIFVLLTALSLFGIATESGWSLTVPFLYCILWIAMPAARTAQDRWAMKGESGTLDEIRRNVSGGIREMGDAAREVGSSGAVQTIGRIIVVIIGLGLLLVGAAGLASVGVMGLKGAELFGEPLRELWSEFSQDYPSVIGLAATPWVVVLAAVAVTLPFIAMLYGGCQLVFGFKEPSWRPGLWIFVLWLLVLVVLLVVALAGFLSTELVI